MEINEIVLKAISEKKGFDILDYDMKSLTPFMDHMIVCSTTNIRQNYAIAMNIKDRLKEAGWQGSFHMEGDSDSKWILLDLEECVVQLFVQEERQVYQLDRLYCDVPVKQYDL
ncbi:ribosome silencing factor [Floccifex sp.]|uniref:ribosome silencing factor n=1 Tax=Floccifex sp. TaxID=2815810 RepID=UPI002A761A37|nr:ribosome silencing factor [Floccifex sp.]MDD7282265.1 ribosome silencing factor [Erysipelotrichaceae bacterium]MDY2958213.1 ribosome silencing factor [Floccifex sp.]